MPFLTRLLTNDPGTPEAPALCLIVATLGFIGLEAADVALTRHFDAKGYGVAFGVILSGYAAAIVAMGRRSRDEQKYAPATVAASAPATAPV